MDPFDRCIARLLDDLRSGCIDALAATPPRRRREWWAGADVIVRDTASVAGVDLHGDLCVATRFPAPVSALFEHLRDRAHGVVDHVSKYPYYENIGEGVLEAEVPGRAVVDVLRQVVLRQIEFLRAPGTWVEEWFVVHGGSIDPAAHLVFAYGSNLSHDRLAGRGVRPRPVARARLHGWESFFNERGKANVRPSIGGWVDGAVWQVTADELAVLDGFEGVQHGTYTQQTVEVQWLQKAPSDRRRVQVYVGRHVGAGVPDAAYLDVIRTGLAEWDIAPEYRRRFVDGVVARGAEPSEGPH
jgi:hypothetical protein